MSELMKPFLGDQQVECNRDIHLVQIIFQDRLLVRLHLHHKEDLVLVLLCPKVSQKNIKNTKFNPRSNQFGSKTRQDIQTKSQSGTQNRTTNENYFLQIKSPSMETIWNKEEEEGVQIVINLVDE